MSVCFFVCLSFCLHPVDRVPKVENGDDDGEQLAHGLYRRKDEWPVVLDGLEDEELAERRADGHDEHVGDDLKKTEQEN